MFHPKVSDSREPRTFVEGTTATVDYVHRHSMTSSDFFKSKDL